MTSAGTPDPDEGLIDLADQRYQHGEWSAALLLYTGLQRRQSTSAIARGVPIALAHCLLELHADADPTALARDLVPPVPGAARSARAGYLRVRALLACRDRDYARALRLLMFVAAFDFSLSTTYIESFLKGRTGCWERDPAAASDEPGFLAHHRWTDAEIDALKRRFRDQRILIVMPWSAPYMMGDYYFRTARAFGLTPRILDHGAWLTGVDPVRAAGRIAREIDAFRPDIVIMGSVSELGFSPQATDAAIEAVGAVFQAARKAHGTRVVVSFGDAWMLPLERVTQGLGRTFDLLHHTHPLLQHTTPRLQAPDVYCYFHPIVTAPTTVEPGSVPHARMIGSVNFSNTARLIWWAAAGQSKLPIEVIETAVEGELKLTPERYADLLRESRFIINLSRRATGVSIITGRTIEALSAGGVLVEEDSFDTRYFLTPGIHYMPFLTWTDLCELVPMLLGDADRRRRLARDGQRWVQRHFSGDWYWAGLLDRLQRLSI